MNSKPALAREAIAALYADNADAAVRSVDYYCKRTIEFDVLEEDATYGIAWAKAEVGEVTLFDYQIGERITRGALTSHKATRADTNLVKAHSTNGAADMAVEEIGIQPVGCLVQYASGVNLDTNFGITDAAIAAALHGEKHIFDPSALAVPAVSDSPFMSSASALWEAVQRVIAVQCAFDGRVRDLAPGSLVGQLGASSYLRSWGHIGGDSALQIPEGFHWARDGQQDSDFSLILRVEENVIVPIALPAQLNASTGYQAAPDKLWIEILAVVRGVEFSGISYNQ